jgi:hypothetical protein
VLHVGLDTGHGGSRYDEYTLSSIDAGSRPSCARVKRCSVAAGTGVVEVSDRRL